MVTKDMKKREWFNRRSESARRERKEACNRWRRKGGNAYGRNTK